MEQPVTLTIEQLGSVGDGIAILDGKRLFVANALPGEQVRLHRLETHKDHQRAEVLEVLTPSPLRAPAPCRHFGQCGGCKLQHLTEAEYARFKLDHLRQTLTDNGLKHVPLSDWVRIPPASRRRVEWKCRREERRWRVGYQRFHSHDHLAAEECPVLEPVLEHLLTALPHALSGMPETLAPAAIQATVLDSGVDMILDVPEFPAHPADWQAWARELGLQRLSLRQGKRLKILTHFGAGELRLGAYSIAVPPGLFLQAAKQGQESLTARIVSYTRDARIVADLFSGIGTYSFPLLEQARTVHAHEGESGMVTALQAAIHQHALKGRLQASRRDLFSEPLTVRELNAYDAVVINPPRAGAASQCKQLAGSGVETVAYVSCNPERFARDAAILLRGGFRLRDITPVDQFVWSPHLELTAHFSRR